MKVILREAGCGLGHDVGVPLHELKDIVIPTLQIRKLRLRERGSFVPDHTEHQSLSQGSSSALRIRGSGALSACSQESYLVQECSGQEPGLWSLPTKVHRHAQCSNPGCAGY